MMETFFEQLSFFFGWVLRSTAQISLLVCLILIIKAILQKRLQARWHYCLWIVLLVRMLMPWAPESRMSVFNLIPDLKVKGIEGQNEINKAVPTLAYIDADTVVSMPAGVPEIMDAGPKIEVWSKPTERLVLGAAEILSLFWLGGAFLLGVYVLAGNFSLWRIVKRQRPLTKQKILDLLEDCKQQMGVQTVLGVVVTERIKSPALFGFVRPRLLLPAGIIESLRDEELRNVFLHELAHLKRHDIGFGWLMAVCQVIHWFNPLVWYGFHRMRIDRELACDALALSRGQADKYCEYGQTIVHLLERFSQPQRLPGLAGILEDKSQLKRRITMIARFKKGSYRWSVLAAVLLTVLSCVVLTNAQGATEEEKKEPTTLAKELVELLVEEEFSEAVKSFDSTMKGAMPAKKLGEIWKATTGQAGLFKQQLGVREEKFLGSDIVLVTCEFEKGPMDVKVVYNDKQQIGGLYFVPTPQDILKSYQQQPAEEINARSKQKAARSTRGPSRVGGKMVKLSVDDGSSEGRKSIAGSGHAVMLDAPGEGCILKTVSIYGSRYGYPRPPEEDFHIWVCDEEFNVIEDFEFPYSRFTREKTKWVTFRVKPVAVPSTFVICAGFNPEQTKGVYVHYDDSSSGNSYTGLPGKEMAVFNDGEWMIRAVIEQKDTQSLHKVDFKDSFENGAGVPAGWKKGNNVPGVKYIWDKNNGSDGRASLCLKKTANKYFPIAQWTRKIEHKSDASKLAVSAKIKAQKVTKAILDVLFLDKNSEWIKHEWVSYIGEKKEERVPPANHNWKKYSGTVEIPENTKSIVIGLQIYGPGTVWFDELEVTYLGESDETKGEGDKLAAENLTAEGWRMWGQRKLAEAEEKFKEAISNNPEADGAYQGLGWAQLNQGKKLNAKDSFEKCIKLNPENSAALNGLGWIVHGQGNIEEAIGWWEKAVTAQPGATASLNGLTQVYMEKKEYDKAIKYYEMWLKVEPDNKQAREGMEKAKVSLKDK